MRWTFAEWRSELQLPFGASWLAESEALVGAGEVVARGTSYRTTRRIAAAKLLRCPPEGVRALLRVGVGDMVRAGSLLARAGRRFARAIVAPEDGRLVHVDANGDLHVASVRGGWEVRAPIDGRVTRADPRVVAIEGASWALEGLAGYGPDRAGPLAIAVGSSDEELAPSRLAVELRASILVGGRRASGEALTRAHAVGVSGVVTAAVSFRSLVTIYGENVSAFGHPTLDDLPTVLVLGAFGRAPFPGAVFAALRELAGARAAIDTRNARLHVFAPERASVPVAPSLELEEDLSGARLARG